MRLRSRARIFVTLLLLSGLPALGDVVRADDQHFGFGMGMGTRVHYSKNSLQVTPGPAATVTFAAGELLELRLRSHVGAFIGHNIALSGDVLYPLSIGAWKPRIGASLSVAFGSFLFHTEDADYLFPSFPELGGEIVVIPARFEIGRYQVSFLEFGVGTDLALLGKVLLLDLYLIQLTVML